MQLSTVLSLSTAVGFDAGQSRPGAATLSGMSRVLICALLVTVLSGGTQTGMVAVTGLAVPPETADADDQPRPGTAMFGWPLGGRPAVVRVFEAPAVPDGPGHRGVDLASLAGGAARSQRLPGSTAPGCAATAATAAPRRPARRPMMPRISRRRRRPSCSVAAAPLWCAVGRPSTR